MYRNQHRTLNYEWVKQLFQEAGCQLLSTEYKNARTKLDYICNCGNKSSIVFDSFRRGNRCRKCGDKKAHEKQRYSIEEIRYQSGMANFTLLTNKYTGCKTPMEFICNVCKRSFIKSWNGFEAWKNKCVHSYKPHLEPNKRKGIKKPRNRPAGSACYQWREDRNQLEKEIFFKQKCYKLLRAALKSLNKTKEDKTHKLLGYTYLELTNHIEGHKNWELVKNDKWHIDHIFPIQAFVEWGISDISIINCLENLRPLSAKENLAKSDNYDLEEFKIWLLTKGIAI